MKRLLALLLASVLALSLLPAALAEEASYSEAPMLTELVEQGVLPPVEERLPLHPEIYNDAPASYVTPEEGNYGGTMKLMSSQVSWCADLFIMMYESMVTMDWDTSEVYGNVVVPSANEDGTEFTFQLLEGMRWSDGEPVTMEDVLFTWNDFVNNEELTPAVSSWLHSGGDSSADLMQLQQVDDWTYTMTSSKPYGGFLVNLGANCWPVYSALIKPAHYLKPFHKAYAEECHGSLEAYYDFIRPVAEKLGYDDPAAEGVWGFVFNASDVGQWELCDPQSTLTAEVYPEVVSTNFPMLNPWIMESGSNQQTVFVRNPYYWKVDQWGNQLPYLDRVTCSFLEDAELLNMNVIAGNIDMTYSSVDTITVYREMAPDTVANYLTKFTGYPCIFYFNYNYDEDPSFVEAMQYPEFRKALGYAIDCDEINDAIYAGLGEPSRQEYMATYDPEKARAMLDELGFVDADGDGWRETPEGLPIAWNIYPQEAGGMVKPAELIRENFADVGIQVFIQVTEASYWMTLIESNQAPMVMSSSPEAGEWRFQTWDTYRLGSLWKSWWETRNQETPKGQEPPEEIKRYFTLIEQTMEKLPSEVVSTVLPELIGLVDENAWYLIALDSCATGFTVNANYGNVSENDPNSQFRETYGEFYFDRSAAE